ncbi:MAG: hypothetical protein IJA23_03155 [Clostridia bacterium]|nr:hypothetical protein [Clostridia bacterium]
MDKLQELKKQLVEQGKNKAFSEMNGMLSMIPEIRETIAKLKKLEKEFFSEYSGKRIYFAPKSPTTKEYAETKKDFFEQIMRFRETYLEVSEVLRSTSRVHNTGIVTLNEGLSGSSFYGFARDFQELNSHSAASKFEEAMKHFFESEFETSKHGKVKLIDQSGKFDQRIVEEIENAKGLQLSFLGYPAYDILDEDEWESVVREVKDSKERIIKKINEDKEKGYSTNGREKTLKMLNDIESKIAQIESMELNNASAPKAKAGDSLSFITENKGMSAGKGMSSRQKGN